MVIWLRWAKYKCVVLADNWSSVAKQYSKLRTGRVPALPRWLKPIHYSGVMHKIKNVEVWTEWCTLDPLTVLTLGVCCLCGKCQCPLQWRHRLSSCHIYGLIQHVYDITCLCECEPRLHSSTGYFDPPLTQILPAAENREEGLKGPVDKQNAKGESQRKHSSHVRMKWARGSIMTDSPLSGPAVSLPGH